MGISYLIFSPERSSDLKYQRFHQIFTRRRRWTSSGVASLAATASMLGVAAVALLAGIYPEGHFDKVHKCTESGFDDLIKTSVDAGKTLFVRWIASEG